MHPGAKCRSPSGKRPGSTTAGTTCRAGRAGPGRSSGCRSTRFSCAAGLLVYRRRLWASAGILAALWNIALAWPSIQANVQAAFADAPSKGKPLKVVSFNLSFDNPAFGQTADFLAKSGADVIGLSEV